MKDFDSFSGYLRFATAREFTYTDQKETSFKYTKNRCEKIGDALATPVMRPLDFTARNSRNPLLIAALTVVGIFLSTLIFYPAVFAGVFTETVIVCLKAVAFTLTQTTILGLGLRTLGRLNNRELKDEWLKQRIIPQPLGSMRI